MIVKNLTTRVSLASIFSILLFGLTIGIYSLRKEREYRTAAIRSEIVKSASFFVHQAYIILKQPDETALLNASQVVQQNVSKGNFSFVEIADAKGNLIVPYDPLELGGNKAHSRAIQKGPWGSLALGQDYLFREENYEDVGSVIEGVFGIVERDRILGYVILGVSQKPIQNALLKSMLTSVALLGALLLAGIWVCWKSGQIAMQPVLNLARTIETLQETDEIERLNIKGAREVEILSSAFRNYVSKNRGYEQEMQKTIQEKTKFLERTKREMKAILDISNRLTKVVDVEGLAAELIETARQIVYCNEAYLFLIVPRTEYTFAARFGNEPPKKISGLEAQDLIQFPKFYSEERSKVILPAMIEKVLRKGDVELIDDTRAHAYQGTFDPAIRACALIPIVSPAASPLGILLLALTGESQFDEEEIARLKGGMKTVGVIVENVLLYSEKERLSRHDSLTGVLNRQNIVESIEKEILIAKRTESQLYVIMADIDYFKNINDTYGHLTGDKVIQTFARIASAARRAGEVVGRYGGEEFLIALPNTDLAAAAVVADKIMSEVRQCKLDFGRKDSVSFTVSLGLASYPENGLSAEDLVGKADQALYAAKARGRNQYVVWEEKSDHRPKSARTSGIPAPVL